jgi:hypothetical protein
MDTDYGFVQIVTDVQIYGFTDLRIYGFTDVQIYGYIPGELSVQSICNYLYKSVICTRKKKVTCPMKSR